MSTSNLMIVESPAKAHTIGKLLGKNTTVLASMGHVRDLPESGGLHVDIANGFQPDYALTGNGRKVISKLKEAAKGAANIYLASDPDREGEAIAWHLYELLKRATKGQFHRIAYHEITKSAIQNAFDNPGEINQCLVNAQQARRILDRLVGFQVSPLACRHVRKGSSAGRVQSVALRLVVEREREIQAFVPVEYWKLEAVFAPVSSSVCRLKTQLTRLNGRKAELHDGTQVNALASVLENEQATSYHVLDVTDTERTQRPSPPFITSTLQQAAGTYLHLGTTQTMKIAQELYEGVDGSNGGLITYMRTDSVNIAKEAQEAARHFIAGQFGAEYVPAHPNVYKSGKSAQEAHEAIRPTDVNRTPDSLRGILTPMQLKVYQLIWNRFVASQMASARQIDHAIEIEGMGTALTQLLQSWPASTENSDNTRGTGRKLPDHPFSAVFRTAARETVFPGYLAVYSMKDLGQEDEMDDFTGKLPALPVNARCALAEKPLAREQCFTQPPGRYSEPSLVKALEANGVGRPSTYAATVKTLEDREYVEKQRSSLVPTPFGCQLCDYLVQQFPELFKVGYTAEMETKLDEIADGNLDWTKMLTDFYAQFSQWLSAGGAAPAVNAISAEKINAALALFGDSFKYDDALGNRKDFDAKFVASIRKVLSEGNKPLSERQQAAFLVMLAKYAARDASLMAQVESIGLGEAIHTQIAVNAAKAEARTERPAASPVDERMKHLMALMSKIEWNAPTKRGRRVFDDGKFFRSVKSQAEKNGTLSSAQQNALIKLASHYVAKYPELQPYVGDVGITTAETVESMQGENIGEASSCQNIQPSPEIAAIMERVSAITSWHPAVKVRNRVFDDRKFCESLREQFQRNGTLSERQVAALQKVLAKYDRGQ